MIEDRNSGNRLAGVYQGKVLQHMTHGYCKIMIYGVYPAEWEFQPEMLPKAEQASPLFGGSFDGNGTFSYPNVGATVWCMFANGDQNLPIYFAAALGGSNAFGQHEIVKHNYEPQSTRHMITSGKSHVEIFENGKISSIVQTPDTRPAVVKFNNEENAYLSTDAVEERPIYDLIADKEISTVNCQHVLDVVANDGEVSSSTYCFMPYSESSAIVLSLEQRTVVSSLDANSEANTLIRQNDAGLIQSDIISSYVQDFKYNDLDALKKYNNIIISSLENDSANSQVRSIDGNTTFIEKNEYCANFTSSYTQLDDSGQSPKVIVLSTMSTEDDRMLQKTDSNYGIAGEVIDRKQSVNDVYTINDTEKNYSDTKKTTQEQSSSQELINDGELGSICTRREHEISRNEVKSAPGENEQFVDMHVEKGKSCSQIQYVENNKIDTSILSTLKIDQTTNYTLPSESTEILKVRSTNNVGSTYLYDNTNQIFSLSDYQYDYKLMQNGSVEETAITSINDNMFEQHLNGMVLSSYRYEKLKTNSGEDEAVNSNSSIEFVTKDNTGMFAIAENKKTKIKFTGNVDTRNGTIELTITSKETGKTSKLTMDINGNVEIKASTNIKLQAPNIDIDGITHITGKTTIDSPTTIKSTLVTEGDATINGSSYTGHTHNYMVPEHPVGQTPTTTRIS